MRFSASLFPHGVSAFKQGNIPQTYETADDLLPTGENMVYKSAEELADQFEDVMPCVHIHSSPMGRALHTARNIEEVFLENHFEVRFHIDPNLGEIGNFSLYVIKALVHGGEFDWKGKKVKIEANLSNPKELSYFDYITEDCIHRIPHEVLVQWPPDFVRRIQLFERFHLVSTRSLKTVYKNLSEHARTGVPHHDIFVGHDTSLTDLISAATDGEERSLHPGMFMLIEFDLKHYKKLGVQETVDVLEKGVDS